ncbi:MAG: hypothetical protein Q9227_005399 [Pyrenula ochraceoflavens]
MSAKRRAAPATSPDIETPNAKRQKTLDDAMPSVETPETTTALGLKLVKMLKNSCDKGGRLVATQFLALPDKRRLPDYYAKIASPIAIGHIEEKLNHGKYENLDEVDQDFKLLIQNAKDYNERKSQIVEDAERIRKAISNFMPRFNPRYKDRNSKFGSGPTPTPISRTSSTSKSIPKTTKSQDVETDGENKPKSVKLKLTNKRALSLTPTIDDSSNSVFVNGSLQSAQERIIEDIIQLRDENGDEIALNFLDLPNKRQYPEYYDQISHPVSLRGIQKKVQGKTQYQTWEDFKKEMSYIWENAKLYNQDESIIFQEAEKIEKFFDRRYTEARIHVKDGAEGTDSGAPKLKISFKPHASTSTGVSVDNEALRRQQDLVKAGTSKKPFTSSSSSNTPNGVPNLTRMESQSTPSISTASSAPVSTVKVEPKAGPSPLPASASMATQPRPSPQPPTQVPALNNVTMPPPKMPTPQPYSRPIPPPPTSAIDSKFRKQGKGLNDALISNVRVSTHPNINLSSHFRIDMPAHSKKTQQSLTFSLPHTHYYLSVEVNLSKIALSRVLRLNVMRNGEKVNASDGSNKYGFRIFPGMNTVTVEAIAGPAVGAAQATKLPMDQIDFEKFTFFIHLLG